MDQTKMQRLLQLLMFLAAGRRYTLAELMERFEISDRTVYRYINTFESAGFIVDKENGYRLLTNNDPARSLGKLFHFSEEEAFILCQVLEQMEGEALVKERLVHKLHALYDFKALTKSGGNRSVVNVASLRDAVKNKKQVVLKSYRSSNSRTILDRQVEPFSFLPDYAAVWCYDQEECQNKQFRVSRIHSVEVLSAGWQYESQHTIPFVDAFHMAAPVQLATVTANLSLKAYNLILEEYPLASQYVKAIGHVFRLDIPVADYNGIGRFARGLPWDMEVEGPEEFKNFLKKKQMPWLGDGS